jgi:hypothetical protein
LANSFIGIPINGFKEPHVVFEPQFGHVYYKISNDKMID